METYFRSVARFRKWFRRLIGDEAVGFPSLAEARPATLSHRTFVLFCPTIEVLAINPAFEGLDAAPALMPGSIER